MPKRKIFVVDQTIREGMQFRGLVFSVDERKKILDFQERLKIDISQCAYPPAHESEEKSLKELVKYSKDKRYRIKPAGLCRSFIKDVEKMIDTGTTEFHLHSIITEEALKKRDPDAVFGALLDSVKVIKEKSVKNVVGVSLLDIGKTDNELLIKCAKFLSWDLKIDILSLPDTSGLLTPDFLSEKVRMIKDQMNESTLIGIHCHNDMGLASANTYMGVLSGGDVIEVSAMGIGERNGIGDIFTVGKMLKDKGFDLNLDTENVELFFEYYNYVNNLCIKKTGFSILNYNTPFFGDAIKTHVAGTHGNNSFGHSKDEEFFVSTLCGKNLVKKVIKKYGLSCDKEISIIVKKLKDRSWYLERALTQEEIKEIVIKI